MSYQCRTRNMPRTLLHPCPSCILFSFSLFKKKKKKLQDTRVTLIFYFFLVLILNTYLVIFYSLFQILFFCQYSNQSSQYRTGTSRYVPYRYIYRYQNINVSYRFKYRLYWSISGNIGRYREYQPIQNFFFFLNFCYGRIVIYLH